MATQTIQLPRGDRREKAAKALGMALQAVISVVRTHSAPARRTLVDHGYTVVGFACISGASFLHSAFTGLIVTGILLLVFEWKVSE